MIKEYVEQLRTELIEAGADPALIQDAVYDAEEYFSSEDASDSFDRLLKNYGTPQEVATSYLESELTVAEALRLPKPAPRRSLLGRFFGVLADPRTYGALFYMFLSFATGITYFTLATVGVSLSISLSIMIFGIPVVLLFLSLIRGVSFIEGRLVEALLGVRMPRRPRVSAREGNIIERIKWWITDRRTWTTLAYMVIQLPIGIMYFTVLVTFISLSLSFMAWPAAQLLFNLPFAAVDGHAYMLETWIMPFIVLLGAFSLVILMHLVRRVGRLHGAYAKSMLVGDLEGKGAQQ